MRLFITLLLMLCLTSLLSSKYSFASKETITLNLPPSSLQQWYKPANKRHVWLHVMFKLRREMQAISEYSDARDHQHQLKWAQKLVKDYKKAGDMVPEWKQSMKPYLVDELLDAVKKNNRDKIKRSQRKLASTCRKCHDKYRAITAAIYRSANFSKIKVNDIDTNEELDYMDAMENLSIAMNRIVIGMVDQRYEAAQYSINELEKRMDNLAHSCSECHKSDAAKETLLGKENKSRFKNLRQFLKSKNIEKAGRTVGEIAVTACARCHSIHRTASDLRDVFQ